MAVAFGVLGACTGVAVETVTTFAGKKIGPKALAPCFRRENRRYAKELGDLLGPQLLGCAVISILHNNPFTIGMKVGMVATAAFFRASDASHINRQDMVNDPLVIDHINNRTPGADAAVQRAVLSKFRLGFASSLTLGCVTEAASSYFNYSFPNNLLPYVLTNLFAYVFGRNEPD